MGKSASQSQGINLLRTKSVFVDSFLYWALTTGRLLIIFTETIALVVFVMRFSLDRQIVDLHDKINHDDVVVNLLQNKEATYRNLQNRLLSIQEEDAISEKNAKTFSELFSIIPQDVTLQSFTLEGTTLQLDLTMNSTSPLQDLLKNLKSQKIVASISVDKISDRITSGIIEVVITSTLQPSVSL